MGLSGSQQTRIGVGGSGLPYAGFVAKAEAAEVHTPRASNLRITYNAVGGAGLIYSFSAKTEAVDTGGTGFYIKIKRRYN